MSLISTPGIFGLPFSELLNVNNWLLKKLKLLEHTQHVFNIIRIETCPVLCFERYAWVELCFFCTCDVSFVHVIRGRWCLQYLYYCVQWGLRCIIDGCSLWSIHVAGLLVKVKNFPQLWFNRSNLFQVMLGSGERQYEDWMRVTESYYKDKFRGWVGFNVPISHRITAG